jgi:hypothetical protein
MSKRKWSVTDIEEVEAWVVRNHDEMRNHVKTLEKELKEVVDGEQFFALYDMLVRHNSGFVHNRESLVEAFKRGGELYFLQILETDELFKDRELRLKLAYFLGPQAAPALLYLPVFCWRRDGTCMMLWVAPFLQKLGLASDIIKKLDIKGAHNVLPDSRSFWEHVGIPEV